MKIKLKKFLSVQPASQDQPVRPADARRVEAAAGHSRADLAAGVQGGVGRPPFSADEKAVRRFFRSRRGMVRRNPAAWPESRSSRCDG